MSQTLLADASAWPDDLAGCDKIETSHLAEAIQYRPRKQT